MPIGLPPPHPWFKPLWRRLLVLGVCLVWLTVEAVFNRDSPFWLGIAAVVTVYAVWDFFLRGGYRDGPEDEGGNRADR